MSTLEALTGRNYLSYSALNTLNDCGERFRLERVVQVPQTQAWWFIGGSAFHLATEWLDRGEQEDPLAAWRHALEQELAEAAPDGDYSAIRAGGRASKQWPNKENLDWWAANGPQLVSDYVAWREGKKSEGWQLFDGPAGPAIEVPIAIGFDDVLVKGFIDRVFVNGDGELIVVDLKTGNHKPASSLQLGVYALGVERHLGVRPILGSYYMARKAELSEPASLLHFSPELVGQWFSKAKKIIEAELFMPHVTSLCGTCSVSEYCAAVGGPKASLSHQPFSL